MSEYVLDQLNNNRQGEHKQCSRTIRNSWKRSSEVPAEIIFQLSSVGDDQIGVKIKSQKHPYGFQQNAKKSHSEFPSLTIFKKACIKLYNTKSKFEIKCLCFAATICRHHHKSSHPKKELPNFRNLKKYLTIEKVKPKNVLRPPPQLEIWSTPLPPPPCGSEVIFSNPTPCPLFNDIYLNGYSC